MTDTRYHSYQNFSLTASHPTSVTVY